jgi:hypothetical protein
MMQGMKTFTITSQSYYEQYNQCYKNILMVNVEPQGPLRRFVRRIKLPKLSPFQVEGPCNPIQKCGLALQGINYSCNNTLMTPNEIPDLITFLLSNGYQIETQLTNMLNQSEIKLTDRKVAFTVTYYGANQPNIMYMR